MNKMTLNNAFKQIIITNDLRSIRSLFLTNNGYQINYKPPYQREYVWPPFKATYFIETILLHSEFPPIVTFERRGVNEIIDGRQRCETIDVFLKDQLALKSSGLEKLWYLANKKFSHLEPLFQERIKNAKIRVITIQFKNEAEIDLATEELVKREFFRRYNFGLSTLKKEEVYKAQYLKDDINTYFKKRFSQDEVLYAQVKNIFDHRARNIEVQMQSIRQLLVLHNIPIQRFVKERDDIVNKYYDYLSYENSGGEKARPIFNKFKDKISFLVSLKPLINKEAGRSNGLVYECLYWALSLAEEEKVKFDRIDNKTFKERLVKHFGKHMKIFYLDRSNHSHQVMERYKKIADFFSVQLHIDVEKYLKNEQFMMAHKDRMQKYMNERFRPGLEQEYFSKSTPTSSTIIDIIEQMKINKFNIRPSYQRDEVPNRAKASSLIESILKHIRLPPLYLYVKKDGTYEVIDGQQRLLAIIGYMGESYRTMDGIMEISRKHLFPLKLRTGLMQELHGLKYTQLPEELRERIRKFSIDIIEISEENNPHFKPEELFKRLNHKPFPIKEHSFEFWNAYIDSNIINFVKGIRQKNPWLYVRKANVRMLNEELVMQLIYFICMTKGLPSSLTAAKEVLSINLWKGKINIKLKNKPQITRLLENERRRQEFHEACARFEPEFLEKLKILTYRQDSNNFDVSRGRQLDTILHTKGVRTFMHFYLLWIILREIPVQTIYNLQSEVRSEISKVFEVMEEAESTEEFESCINEAWKRINKHKLLPSLNPHQANQGRATATPSNNASI